MTKEDFLLELQGLMSDCRWMCHNIMEEFEIEEEHINERLLDFYSDCDLLEQSAQAICDLIQKTIK
jgi:hypothetical protein